MRHVFFFLKYIITDSPTICHQSRELVVASDVRYMAKQAMKKSNGRCEQMSVFFVAKRLTCPLSCGLYQFRTPLDCNLDCYLAQNNKGGRTRRRNFLAQ